MRSPDTFQTDEIVPETGIYRVVHDQHRLPHEVIILKDERFPRCAKCQDAVLFTLIHADPALEREVVHRVFELAVLDDEFFTRARSAIG